MKHINLNLPDELHAKFKIVCATQGKQMTDVLLAAVNKYLEGFTISHREIEPEGWLVKVEKRKPNPKKQA